MSRSDDCLPVAGPRGAAALAAVIVVGLAVDQAFVWGQLAIDVAVWSLFAALLVRAPRGGRGVLAACVAIAAAGEYVLSLGLGLYDYRLGNVPLFVPPGHALLLLLGMLLAARVGDWVTWLVPAAAAPVVVWQAAAGADTLGVLLFAVFLLAVACGRAKKLYAVMFALSLAMEFYGTWLGNWTWQPAVRGLGLAAGNPPLTAGAFYCVLDVLVLAATRRRQAGAAPSVAVAS